MGQLGIHVDRDSNRLIATNMNAAPLASSVQGVFAFNITTGEEIWYWNATTIATNFTPNDVTTGNGKVYVTNHVQGHVMEIQDATTAREIVRIQENMFLQPLDTRGRIINGIEYISDKVLLVGFMTPPEEKGKLFRVDIGSGSYAEIPLPDCDGVGRFSRMDGIYKEDDRTIWVMTNSGNQRVLKIVASDNTWTDIEAVYASLPSTCAAGPTTGVLVGNRFVTTGDAVQSHLTRDLSLVWASGPVAAVVAAAEAQGVAYGPLGSNGDRFGVDSLDRTVNPTPLPPSPTLRAPQCQSPHPAWSTHNIKPIIPQRPADDCNIPRARHDEYLEPVWRWHKLRYRRRPCHDMERRSITADVDDCPNPSAADCGVVVRGREAVHFGAV